MQELQKGQEIAFTGPRAEEALLRCKRQIADWQVALPEFEPLVLDFGLHAFEDTGLIEFWLANEEEAGYCGKYLFVFDGQTCPMHRHEKKHETFFVVKGKVRMQLDGRSEIMEEGAVLPVPQGKFHSFTGLGPALLLELSSPCFLADNEFENSEIPIGRVPPSA